MRHKQLLFSQTNDSCFLSRQHSPCDTRVETVATGTERSNPFIIWRKNVLGLKNHGRQNPILLPPFSVQLALRRSVMESTSKWRKQAAGFLCSCFYAPEGFFKLDPPNCHAHEAFDRQVFLAHISVDAYRWEPFKWFIWQFLQTLQKDGQGE